MTTSSTVLGKYGLTRWLLLWLICFLWLHWCMCISYTRILTGSCIWANCDGIIDSRGIQSSQLEWASAESDLHGATGVLVWSVFLTGPLKLGELGMGVAWEWPYFPNIVGVFAVSSKVVDIFLICNPGELIDVPKDTETLGLLSNKLHRKNNETITEINPHHKVNCTHN